ncbi:hypothetical protein AB0J52_38155, partial [Spirillospora sp. NPDC049652]
MPSRLSAPAIALPACAALLTGPPAGVGLPGHGSARVAVHEVAASAAGRALARWPVRGRGVGGRPPD